MKVCDVCRTDEDVVRAFIKVVRGRKHVKYVQLGDLCRKCLDELVESVRKIEEHRPEKRIKYPPCFVCGNEESFGAYLYVIEKGRKIRGKVLGHYCMECLDKISERKTVAVTSA